MSSRACFSAANALVFVFRGVLDAFEGVGDALAELDGLVAELFVGEGLDGGLEVVDLLNDRHEALDGALVAGTKDLSYSFIEQNGCPS